MQIYDDVALSVKERSIKHMLAAVQQTPAEQQPFPHFVVRGLLPDDIYREMLALLPNSALYEDCRYQKHSHDGVINRMRFKMTNADLDRLSGSSRSLWLGVRDALGSVELKEAVFAKLSAGLAFRFSLPEEKVSRLAGFARPELFRETAHYSIAPHPDTRRKVVTMQIALPADNSQEQLGTEFYRRAIDPRSYFREPRGFEIAKRPPFLPNTAYAFVVLNTLTLRSWHGRTAISITDGARNSILNIWYADAADANPDLVGQQVSKAA